MSEVDSRIERLGRQDFAWLMSDRRRDILQRVQREVVAEIVKEPPAIIKAIRSDGRKIAGAQYLSQVQRWADALKMIGRHSPALADRIRPGIEMLMLEDDD